MSFFSIFVTAVCLSVHPWKAGIGLLLDSTSMRVTTGQQFGQIKMSVFFQAIIFEKLQNFIMSKPLEILILFQN